MKTIKIVIPKKSLLSRTNDVDYYHWNYKFPIKYIQQYRFKTIVRLLGNKTYHKLLEFGTGSGIFLPELSRHCENLFACDIHPHFKTIEHLLKSYQVSNFHLKSQSIEKTDYPDNYFDVIVAVSVLEFVDDLEAATNEILRILSDDGVFMTICPMESKFLDTLLSVYSDKKPKEEFGAARTFVGKILEKKFTIIEKGYMLPFLKNLFPIYTHYKLAK